MWWPKLEIDIDIGKLGRTFTVAYLADYSLLILPGMLFRAAVNLSE